MAHVTEQPSETSEPGASNVAMEEPGGGGAYLASIFGFSYPARWSRPSGRPTSVLALRGCSLPGFKTPYAALKERLTRGIGRIVREC